MARYKVTLTKEERTELMSLIGKGVHASHKYRAAYVLLNSDVGEFSEKVINEQICKVLKIGMRTIDRIKKRFVEDGFSSCMERKPSNRVYERRVDGDVEAHLVQLCCSEPPDGFARWSLRLLSDKMVELNYISSISHETVRTILKKRIKTMES